MSLIPLFLTFFPADYLIFNIFIWMKRNGKTLQLCGDEVQHTVMGMIDDQDLGFFANFLGIFIFIFVISYHYVMADPKYEGN
ncbi:hypothetical protein AQUCO_02700310v1 [Aquilegia coerulea]|uniref:Dolichyl-diphosphooligosaccharide--protein glycosyltransferase subunit 4 n=1 Tax=Aquilegia coerulea TaxID=218851 RepID=A0A2G5D6A4_AQUCA|nr:hypothetical protein AQUCO_02700310v1 [Aquilegia coerulea]